MIDFLKSLLFSWLFVFLVVPAALSQADVLWTENPPGAVGESDEFRLSLFSRLVEKLSPAVVNIRILEKVPVQPYLDFPLGRGPGTSPNTPPGDGYQKRGEGSGFIINKEGYLLTNAHVIEGSDEIQVALKSGKLLHGTIIGIDKVMDVGLVKINSLEPLPILPLGSSGDLKIGEWVMAIGSPFGLQQTVTVGIVSGKGRSLGASPFDDFIQIDAPINPGNSGGPLINTHGEVVGINTMILAQGQGLGFSLPIDLVKRVLPQLKEKGRVVRSWFGVVIQDITIDIQERYGLKGAHGAFIVQVVQGGPAAKAGIQEGDVVIGFNGEPIKNSRELPFKISYAPAGVPIPATLLRGGKEIVIQVVLEKTPNSRP